MHHEFAEILSLILRESGSPLTADELRRITREGRDEIYSDEIAHQGHCNDPFFNFVVAGGVAVFTFFDSDFSIYVIPCNETQLIAEMEHIPMGDVDSCRKYLTAKHGTAAPALVVARSVGESWLETSN